MRSQIPKVRQGIRRYRRWIGVAVAVTLGILAFASNPVFAQTLPGPLGQAQTLTGPLDQINDSFAQDYPSILAGALDLADGLFTLIMGCAILYAIAKAAFESIAGEMNFSTALWPIGRALLGMMIPLIFLKVFARDILPNLIAYTVGAGGLAASMGINVTGAQTPDQIFMIGYNGGLSFVKAAAAPLVAATTNPNLGSVLSGSLIEDAFMAILGSLTLVVVIICFALIAVEVLLAYIEVYLTVSVGAISLGFLASGGTSQFANRYLSIVWGSIMRLLVIFGFVTILGDFLNGWTGWSSATTPANFVNVAAQIIGVSITSIYLTTRLSSVASKFGGGVALSGQDAVSSAKSAVSSMVGR